MKCPQCEHENPSQSKFCLECGTNLALRCASCGTELPAGAKFCNQCGQFIGGQPAVESRFASPESYTPKHLAEKILTSRSALEGERKQVTVLFADLKGSMELLADRDPEEARQHLDPVLERMMEAVHRYEGTVNQVMGDGIMALFGAPVAHEDHAVRACYAALDMQAAIRRYADEVRRSHGVKAQIRVGLNSGEVVVRAVGSDLRMDYTAVGQTTHLAARMEQLADPASTLLTGDTLRLAEGYIEVKPLGPVPVKGLDTPVDVYELTRAGPLRSRLHAAAARGLTRFVGRETELEQLRQTLGRAAGGHGQVVALVGEAGVGKSRLVWEVTHSHRTHGWLIVRAGSVSYGKATPYLPVLDLLKGYFQMEDRDDHRKIREKVTGKLLTLDRALEVTLPALLALLDVPVEDASWQALDPAQRRQRILEAVKRLLLRESLVQPLLVVFEDLHWIDSETQALLDSLVESVPTTRLLLLVNYRPEYEHHWGGKTYYTQLRLDPLPPESAEELLNTLLGGHPSLGPLTQLLIERTEGNPFFLEESVQTLVETKVLSGERGAYRVARPTDAIQVPATVQAVLAARIDRLPPEEKRLLQSAAVVGHEVPFVLLQAIAELPEPALRRGLTHLQAAEFLYETSLFPNLEYTFKHALTHEVAYGSILQERRRALHARIVETVEQLYADRLTEQVERLAHHAFRGEAWDKALTHFRHAGTKAAARSAYREAVACCEHALAALTHLPQTRETMEQAIDLRFDLRTWLHPLGELGQIFDRLREAETLAETIGDQRRLGWVLAWMANHFWTSGEHERAVESGQRALALAEACGDFALQVVANHRLGQAYVFLGDYRHAIEFLSMNVASLEGNLIRERFGMTGLPSVMSRTWLTWCLAELGRFKDGIASGEGGARIAETVDQPFSMIHAYYGVGHLYLRQGESQKAIPMLERGVQLCRDGDIKLLFPQTVSHLGYAYALSGRIAQAVPLLEEAVKQAASRGIMRERSLWVGWLGEAYLLAGRLADATASARQALGLSREQKERGHGAWALRLLGELASDQEPVDVEKAEGYYREALCLVEELGMRPLAAHCYLGLGKLYRRTGNRPEAQQELTTAITMLRDMDMRVWLEQAEAELKALA